MYDEEKNLYVYIYIEFANGVQIVGDPSLRENQDSIQRCSKLF